LRTQVFRYQIAVQVAIELMLRRGPLATVLEQERDLRQIAYDALYYPARQWEAGAAILDVSSTAFFEEMLTCVPAVETLPESRRRLLLEAVQRVAQYLADLSSLHSEVKDLVDEKRWPEMEEAVVAAIPVGYRLLKPVAGSVEKFEWGYTIHGIPVQAADVALADNAKNDIGLIDKMGEFVAGWLSLSLEKLATEYHVLPTSPPWADVKEALKAVKLAQDTRAPYSLLESHTNILREYAGRLQTNAKALSMALSIVAKLARLSSLEEPEARVDAAFRALSAGLHLTGAPEETTLRRLARTATEAGIATHNPVDMAAGGRFRDWREAVAAPPLARATAEVTAETRAQVFSGWANRLKENLGRAHDFPVGWIDVLGPVLGLEAVALLKPDVRNTTLLAWSKLAVMALQGKPLEEAQYAPFAFAAAALASCGFVQAEVLQDLVKVPASQLELDCMSTLAPAIKALDLAKQKREAEILILSLREKSLAELWMPSTKYRAMLLPPAALEALLTSPGYVVLRFRWLIAESDDLTSPGQPSNPDLAPDKFPETTKLIKTFSREARGYMAARVPSTRLELDGRLLGACRSVDDTGDRMLTTSSPPSAS
ncbi:MAG: hypothetical protein M3O35_06300, partial [Acidobacteriota bacterium]|nr:hypothetical protein [Acidobacteriota bacterium]